MEGSSYWPLRPAMRSAVQLSVSPSGLELMDASRGVSSRTAGIVMLVPGKGRATVAVVGEDESVTRDRIEEQMRTGSLPDGFRIFNPGDDSAPKSSMSSFRCGGVRAFEVTTRSRVFHGA